MNLSICYYLFDCLTLNDHKNTENDAHPFSHKNNPVLISEHSYKKNGTSQTYFDCAGDQKCCGSCPRRCIQAIL